MRKLLDVDDVRVLERAAGWAIAVALSAAGILFAAIVLGGAVRLFLATSGIGGQ